MNDSRKFLINILVTILAVVFIRAFVLESSVVDGTSMEPYFYDEDSVLLDKLFYKYFEIDRFDVIVFEKNISSEEKFLIKRVIGLPGERVKMEYGTLYIDDKAIYEYNDLDIVTNDFEEVIVPEDSYFVLGDNRNNSLDSRSASVGFIAKEDIVGRVFLRYFFGVV